ncbi:hypothetical protein X975_03699, partial [Stegodyphus mimosarum]
MMVVAYFITLINSSITLKFTLGVLKGKMPRDGRLV